MIIFRFCVCLFQLLFSYNAYVMLYWTLQALDQTDLKQAV